MDTIAVSCQVCGAELVPGPAIRRCSMCQTPHHLDCWEYNGGCAIYACRGGPEFVGRALTLPSDDSVLHIDDHTDAVDYRLRPRVQVVTEQWSGLAFFTFLAVLAGFTALSLALTSRPGHHGSFPFFIYVFPTMGNLFRTARQKSAYHIDREHFNALLEMKQQLDKAHAVVVQHAQIHMGYAAAIRLANNDLIVVGDFDRNATVSRHLCDVIAQRLRERTISLCA